MIDVKELRIGSLVNVPRVDQSPFRIDGFEYLEDGVGKVFQHNEISYEHPVFGKMRMHPLTWDLNDLEPIPIAKDILIKFGFAYNSLDTDNAWLSFRYGNLDYDADQSTNYETVFLSVNGKSIKEIKTVNELQNNFYFNTGKELNYRQ